MNLNRTAAFPALLALLLAGCSALQPPRAENPNLYLLDARPAAHVQQGQRERVIVVQAPRALPGFDTARMAYVREPHRLDYYANNRWVDTPARMLAPLLVEALARSGAFRAVLPAPSSVVADLRLDTELLRLQQDFRAQPSRVQLTLRAQLIDLSSNRVIATREFDAAESAPSEDAQGGVIAANRALARVLGELTAFCRAAARGS